MSCLNRMFCVVLGRTGTHRVRQALVVARETFSTKTSSRLWTTLRYQKE